MVSAVEIQVTSVPGAFWVGFGIASFSPSEDHVNHALRTLQVLQERSGSFHPFPKQRKHIIDLCR